MQVSRALRQYRDFTKYMLSNKFDHCHSSATLLTERDRLQPADNTIVYTTSKTMYVYYNCYGVTSCNQKEGFWVQYEQKESSPRNLVFIMNCINSLLNNYGSHFSLIFSNYFYTEGITLLFIIFPIPVNNTMLRPILCVVACYK